MKTWQQCAGDGCVTPGQFKSLDTLRDDLTAAGWVFERQPYDTTRWWYCPRHRMKETP